MKIPKSFFSLLILAAFFLFYSYLPMNGADECFFGCEGPSSNNCASDFQVYVRNLMILCGTGCVIGAFKFLIAENRRPPKDNLLNLK